MLILYILGPLTLLYVFLLATVYLFQERILFKATRTITRTPEELGWGFEEAQLDVMGEKTLVWHVLARDDTNKVFIFSHGNAGNISDRLDSISIFRNMGYNVITYDYGGYGLSTGSANETRCHEDLRAVWEYATQELNYKAKNIILFGRSLGGGPSAQIATEVQPGIVILESTFTSIPDITHQHYPILPGWTMARNPFNNRDKIAQIQAPLLIVHGKKDTLIPYAHGKKLFETATEPKEFLDIDGEHHEGFWMSGAEYTDGLQQFIETHIID